MCFSSSNKANLASNRCVVKTLASPFFRRLDLHAASFPPCDCSQRKRLAAPLPPLFAVQHSAQRSLVCPLAFFRLEHHWCQVHIAKTSTHLMTSESLAPVNPFPSLGHVIRDTCSSSEVLHLAPLHRPPEVRYTQQAPQRNGDQAILPLAPKNTSVSSPAACRKTPYCGFPCNNQRT